ncbi:hypothetical protein ACF3N7_01785 [Cruoricaptor ignavus]|uniref:hypothetical protein n=1 Tax=Cruoricaptor ignavus TaxID=1118202 RepID=UPI00370DD8D4
MTFISFNTAEIKVIRFDEAAENCSEINDEVYQPAEMTPLYDAVGTGIARVQSGFAKYLHTEYDVF